MSDLRDKIIDSGVRNLREFGYQHCDRKNILTDAIYKQFFLSMLKDNDKPGRSKALQEVRSLIKEIEG